MLSLTTLHSEWKAAFLSDNLKELEDIFYKHKNVFFFKKKTIVTRDDPAGVLLQWDKVKGLISVVQMATQNEVLPDYKNEHEEFKTPYFQLAHSFIL